jgi:ADP-L-glycero-D-manno-heptose 6-epimerase
MKILLTGHKGFIGQNMLKALQNTNHEISTFDWEDGNMPSIMEQDWVIHLGAISSTTERDVDKVLRQNYDFSSQLFVACKTYGVNLQYSSSASVYGLGTDFTETAPVDPRNAYAWSKYLFERYHQQHQGGNIVQGFRYFNVYGPSEDHKSSQASPYHQFAKQAREFGSIKVFENSHKYHRDFVPVEQVIATHLAFLNSQESGIFNIGTGTTQSFLEVAESFRVPIETIPMPEQLKASYQKYTCADMTKTNRVYDHTKRINAQ